MNVKNIRRENLRLLARQAGGICKLADKLNRSQSQISHLICNNYVKNIGDRLACYIEQVFNKPLGWLDQIHDGSELDIESTYFITIAIPTFKLEELDSQVLQKVNMPKTNQVLCLKTNSTCEKMFAISINAQNLFFIPNNHFTKCLLVINLTVIVKNNDFVVAKLNKYDVPALKKVSLQNGTYFLSSFDNPSLIKELSKFIEVYGVVNQLIVNFK